MRRIRTAVIIIGLLLCVITPGIMLLFQPKTLKVATGTPLTQAGEYEGPGGGTLYVTPSHRLVGAVTLPETPYGSSFIVVPMDGLKPDFEEMQSFFLGGRDGLRLPGAGRRILSAGE